MLEGLDAIRLFVFSTCELYELSLGDEGAFAVDGIPAIWQGMDNRFYIVFRCIHGFYEVYGGIV